jgi:transcriptional regulator with XRE-family HTH domain
MDLRTYLFKHRITQTDFARRVGISLATVQNIIKGVQINLMTAKLVEVYTLGEVKALSMVTPKVRKRWQKAREEKQIQHANALKIKRMEKFKKQEELKDEL